MLQGSKWIYKDYPPGLICGTTSSYCNKPYRCSSAGPFCFTDYSNWKGNNVELGFPVKRTHNLHSGRQNIALLNQSIQRTIEMLSYKKGIILQVIFYCSDLKKFIFISVKNY